MNRNALLVALLVVLSLGLGSFGCTKRAPDANRVATATVNDDSAAETLATPAIETELKRIENDFPRVLREKDTQAIELLEADDVVVVYPDGELGSKAQDISDIKTGALSADSWEVTDMKVTVLDKNAAFITGRSIVKGGKNKTADGKTIDISGQYRWIDTFARRNGEWKLVASAVTPIINPIMTPAPSPPPVKVSPTVAASPMATTTQPTP